MRKKIVIEMEAEQDVLEQVSSRIKAAAVGQYAAAKMESFRLKEEELPDHVPELTVPSFLVRRPFAGDRERGACL